MVRMKSYINNIDFETPHFPGIVVQSVRAPPCQGGSCGFEPRQSRPRIRWIHQFISPFSVKRGDKEQDLIPCRRILLSFRIYNRTNYGQGIKITITSTDWWGRDICRLVQSEVSPYSGFKERLVWLFSIVPDQSNRVPICFPGAHKKWDLFIVRYAINLT